MASSMVLGGELTQARADHIAWLATHKAADGSYDMKGEALTEFHTRNDALAAKQAEYDAALLIEKSAAESEAKLAPQGRIISGEIEPVDPRIKTPDQLDAAFKSAFKAHAAGISAMANGADGSVRFELPVEAKTLITLADHYPPADRQQTTGSALYYGNVEDLFLPGATSSNNIEYFIQTTDTDNTNEVAEGSAASESAFVWTKTTDEVETIQGWIPVTREFLNDQPGMQSVVTGMLAARLQKEVNQQLLSGTGTTPQLWGAAIRTGFQTQAKGADPSFDAIGKAILKVQVTGDADPSAIVMHPTDWWNMRLTRTVDGVYILGNPGDAASFMLFGLPVRLSTGIGAAGTALVGAFNTMTQIFNNGGVTVEASSEHSTYFTERKVALAVSRRLSVASYRPSGFCTVTGL